MPGSPYEQALAFLYGRIDYERTRMEPYQARRFKLDRMRKLLRLVGNPHQGLPVVHIAGTKGKGSTAAIVGSILKEAGQRVGLYTSPHLDKLEERLVVDAQICQPDELVQLVDLVREAVDQMDTDSAANDRDYRPTYFEITTVMAMLHFRRQNVDIGALEVGLGGRLDSTNVCEPLVSVITSISYDHMKQLGNTLAEIAAEKAGIIKPGVPIVSGVRSGEARTAIEQIAQQQGSRSWTIGEDFGPRESRINVDPIKQCLSTGFDYWQRMDSDRELSDLQVKLVGQHQADNAAVAIAAISQIGTLSVSPDAIRRGLAAVQCRARVEIVAHNPLTVIDAAHNGASVNALVDAIEQISPPQGRTLVFATSQDKDAAEMLRLLLPHFDSVILTKYGNNPRARDPNELLEIAGPLKLATGARSAIMSCPTSIETLAELRRLRPSSSLVCVTGSFFIAAEMRGLLRE